MEDLTDRIFGYLLLAVIVFVISVPVRFIVGAWFVRLPTVQGYEWQREVIEVELYDKDGERAASIVLGAPFPIPGRAQVCDFKHTGPCRYFRTDQEAVEWLVEQYERGANESKRVPR